MQTSQNRSILVLIKELRDKNSTKVRAESADSQRNPFT